MHIRLGRLLLRSWHPFVMWLPAGFREPLTVWLVEEAWEQDGQAYQLGAFTTEREAQACMAQLKSEGPSDLHINIVTVHHRVSDWAWNR